MRNGAASGSGSLCSSSSTGTVHALLEAVRMGGRLRAQPAGQRPVVRTDPEHVVGNADPAPAHERHRHPPPPPLRQDAAPVPPRRPPPPHPHPSRRPPQPPP